MSTPMHISHSLIPCGPVAVLLTAVAAHAQCLYDAQIMMGLRCEFDVTTSAAANGVNACSVVVGSANQCHPDYDLSEGFVWTLESGMDFIERPDWMLSLAPQAVSERGQVVVNTTIECDACGFMAFLYERGVFVPLPLWPGANYSMAASLNTHGVVVGWSGNVIVGPGMHAALWQDAQVVDIGALLPTTVSAAWDVNDNNVVVGSTESPPSNFEAFIYDHGRVQMLGPIPSGVSSSALAINNCNVVVGVGQVPGPSPSGYVGRAFRWSEGVMTDLGVLPGEVSSSATDLNDKGVIVGWGDGPSDERAYIWYGDTPIDLNTLVVTDQDLIVEGATDINASGQITAVGRLIYDGQWIQVGVLLTPKVASPADLTGDCHVDSLDLAVLLRSWGQVAPGKRNANSAADLDGNGIVNGFDLAILLAAWG